MDEQYDLFICGNQFIPPPASYLARPFAKRGSEVVPFLRQKLIETQNELTIRDIAAVLVESKRLSTYDFSKDDLVVLLDQKANAMHGPWKKVVRDMVDELK